MLFLRRCANLSLLLLLLNAVPLLDMLRAPAILWAAVLIPLSAYYVFFNIRPRDDRPPTGKLKALISGYEQIWTAEVLVCVEIAFYVSNGFLSYLNTNLAALIIGAALCIALIWGILLVGFIRLFAASGQLGLALRAALILLWWAPGLNFILLHKARKTTGAEFDFSVKKHRLEKSREGAAYCETKYPLLLVHGIFFRDWERLSYWGRIPQALGRVGASVFYGGQQSSASLEASAAELAARIRGVLAQTGAEKVNIIAHSKGGLDARYAISRLGMGPQVASLTTVNTPHWGSALATKLMRVAPDKLVLAVGKQYDALFKRLGDDQPDFFRGIAELTQARCKELDELMPDDPGVYYQSVGSKMKTARSAPFPLNLGYSVIRPLRGDNDGLVSVDSMAWGHFLGVCTGSGRRGVSHGDMIDLTRKNIPGFDVCEFYAGLVHRLKEMGL